MNPLEAFFFGAAVLIHDAGMTLVAYPNGLNDLIKETTAKDIIFNELKYNSININDHDEILTYISNENTKKRLLPIILRELHGEKAKYLLTQSWKYDGNDVFILENRELRDSYGQSIGLIAASHSKDLRIWETYLPRWINPLAWMPSDWRVDMLKISCLLRAVDAAHIYHNRAPFCLLSILNITGASKLHWISQGKVHAPTINGDKLIYTSSPFSTEEAESWWLLYDMLSILDIELKRCKEILDSQNIQNFEAIGVEGVMSPKEIRNYIPTLDWEPIYSKMQCSDVLMLIERFGGEKLYGKQFWVPLRELIQNSIDAIHARRCLDEDDSWGKIEINLYKDNGNNYLEVKDNGIGMSPQVLSEVLLDFGMSLWRSSTVRRELPGLQSSSFRSIGQFGIGFFSVFMLSQHIQVISRRFDKNRNDLYILDFIQGIQPRPILRKCNSGNSGDMKLIKSLSSGGTIVRLHINNINNLISKKDLKLIDIIRYLCPASDVDIYVSEREGEMVEAIRNNDWHHIPDSIFFQRINLGRTKRNDFLYKSKLLLDPDSNKIFGRIALLRSSSTGEIILTTGGIMNGKISNDFRAIGVVDSKATNLCRDQAELHIPKKVWEIWAESLYNDFVKILKKKLDNHLRVEYQLGLLEILLPLAGNRISTKEYPIGMNRKFEYITAREFQEEIKESESCSIIFCNSSERPNVNNRIHPILIIEVNNSFYYQKIDYILKDISKCEVEEYDSFSIQNLNKRGDGLASLLSELIKKSWNVKSFFVQSSGSIFSSSKEYIAYRSKNYALFLDL